MMSELGFWASLPSHPEGPLARAFREHMVKRRGRGRGHLRLRFWPRVRCVGGR
jgi:hypothetical protein